MKTYTEDEVLEILKKLQNDIEQGTTIYTKGMSDGYECWDVEEIDFPKLDLITYLSL